MDQASTTNVEIGSEDVRMSRVVRAQRSKAPKVKQRGERYLQLFILVNALPASDAGE